MAFFNKRMILLFTNLFLLAGIGTTIANYSKSVIQGDAATNFSMSIKKYDTSSFGSGVSDGTLSYGTTSSSITVAANTGSATVNVTYNKNSSTTTTIFNNTAGEIRLYPGATNGGSLTYAISSGYKIISFQIKSSQNPGSTINGGTSFTSLNFTENFNTLTTTVVLKNEVNATSGTTNQLRTTEAIISYQSIDEINSESFSTNFLSSTENKQGFCNLNDLNWSTLESDYNALTVGAQNEFKTNTTNQTIIDARGRYNYLISYNNTLNDFVYGV